MFVQHVFKKFQVYSGLSVEFITDILFFLNEKFYLLSFLFLILYWRYGLFVFILNNLVLLNFVRNLMVDTGSHCSNSRYFTASPASHLRFSN